MLGTNCAEVGSTANVAEDDDLEVHDLTYGLLYFSMLIQKAYVNAINNTEVRRR